MQFLVIALASLAVASPVFQREASNTLTLRLGDYSYLPSYGGGSSGGGSGGNGGGNNGGGNNGGGNGGNGGNGGGNTGGGSGGFPFDACSGLMDTPQCCATDVLGVACLDSSNVPDTITSRSNFQSQCAAEGLTAACCVLPILGQALLCSTL